MELRRELAEAYKDYKYFLNRGYSRKVALEAITSRYNLSVKEKMLLYRCVHSDDEIKAVKSKVVKHLPKSIIIDGYNIGITFLSIVYDDEVFICDDGFIRDLGLGKRKLSDEVYDALLVVSEFLENLGISFQIVLDSQISKSGELAEILRNKGLNVRTVKKADKQVIISKEIVASNDFVILYNAYAVFDVLGLLVSYSGLEINVGPWSEKI
ncbi:MAG: DUF434 domain-containing protein [Sulfolobaceae archaeon]|nr:DUF434 domain-containing protein [Sulfolobaceae archaeon]